MTVPFPYRDPSRRVSERVEDLLARMTLEEKAAQLAAPFGTSVDVYDPPPAGWGCVVAGLAALGLPPREAAKKGNELQRKHVEDTRLGIPVLIAEEALVGLKVRDAATFPDAIAQAAMWDPETLERVGRTIGSQMVNLGVRQALSPLADVARDPRWGRVEETYGEEPYLVGTSATAFVRGLQGADDDKPLIATLKHFLGYSASAGGRNTEPAAIGARELREVHAVPFEMAIRDGGALGVMPSYNDIDGDPVTGSRAYLTTLLREEMGFDGLVMSDLGAVGQLFSKHRTTSSTAEAQATAVRAGVDLDLDNRVSTDVLIGAVRSGELEEVDLDRAVSVVLTAKFRLGLFENPYVDVDAVPETFDTDDERALARTVAERSAVLLQNDPFDGAPVLPLNSATKSIAVIGPNADRPLGQVGNYSYHVLDSMTRRFSRAADPTARAKDAADLAGSSGPDDARQLVDSVPLVTFLDGIRERASGATVRYERGCPVAEPDRSGIAAAVQLAAESDVAVLVVGDQAGINAFGTVGEGLDSSTCELPGVQRELIEAVAATGTPTVVVLSHGRPYVLGWLTEKVPAIVTTFFGGEEAGNALASVLFGDVNPGGRLPVTFLESVGAAPLPYWRALQPASYVDGPAGAVFPLGHGLSYTTFAYSDLEIEQDEVDTAGVVKLAFTVANTGGVIGDEVVQVYGQDVVGRTVRPDRKLVGYLRIRLDAGAAVRVKAKIPAELFALWDIHEGWVVEPGVLKFYVGGSSAVTPLRGRATLTGKLHRPGQDRALTSRVDTHPVGLDTSRGSEIQPPRHSVPPISDESTVMEWLDHPIGGDILREMLGGAGEEALPAALGLSLKQMADYSSGQFPAEELLVRTRQAMER